MKINRNAECPCGSGKKYKRCCGIDSEENKFYLNEAHEWMDINILKGQSPDLHGYLVLIDHNIPAGEIWNQLKFWSEQYIDFGENRTQICHRIIDQAIEHEREIDISEGYSSYYCSKGCSNCCCQPVACTDEEAQLIYRHCIENRISIDFIKLQRQQKYMEFDSSGNFTGITTWNYQEEEDQCCVFLDSNDGSCRIWEVRPFVCRVHLAEKTDKHCKTYNGIPDPDARGIHYPICSYILSTVFTIHHDSVGKMMNRLLLNQKFIENTNEN